MSEGPRPSGEVIDSVDQIDVGDGLYSEGSMSPYWVEELTSDRVVLRDRRDSPHTWVRETFEASLDAHSWVRQSTASAGAVVPSANGVQTGRNNR